MTMIEQRFESQPREREVPCRICRRGTWNVSGMCDVHDSAIPFAVDVPAAAPAPVSPPPPPVALPGRRTNMDAAPADGLLRIRKLDDPVVEAHGHHVRSEYVETFWLPVLGPSVTWLLRRASYHLEDADEFVVEAEVLGKCLGLHGVGRNSALIRSFARAVAFRAAAADAGPWGWRVRTHLGDLPRRHAARLPRRSACRARPGAGGAAVSLHLIENVIESVDGRAKLSRVVRGMVEQHDDGWRWWCEAPQPCSPEGTEPTLGLAVVALGVHLDSVDHAERVRVTAGPATSAASPAP